jgi:hypothetical protein
VIDMLNDAGEVDRGKVIAEVDRLLSLLPSASFPIIKVNIRQGFINLTDELHTNVYAEACGDMQEIA